MPTMAIFGATGRTGKRVLERALAAGWTVRALVRNPSAVTATSNRLTIIHGDATIERDLATTVAGSDVVVSLLGQSKGSPPRLQTDATRAIIAAMQATGVNRIVSLTGGGVAAPQDEPKPIDRLFTVLLRRLTPDVLADGEAHARLIQESGLHWTIVRGPRLTEGRPAGRYRVGWVGVNASTQIDRDDLADFILTEAAAPQHTGRMPFVSR